MRKNESTAKKPCSITFPIIISWIYLKSSLFPRKYLVLSKIKNNFYINRINLEIILTMFTYQELVTYMTNYDLLQSIYKFKLINKWRLLNRYLFYIFTLETKLESHSTAQYPWDGFSYRITSLNSCMRRKIEITEPISNLDNKF